METRTTERGRTLYVDPTDVARGSKGPFFVVYTTESRADRWGYYCSNCETFDVAMDAMGRIECNRCRNLHKAEEWDAAHE